MNKTSFLKQISCWAWWCMPVIPAPQEAEEERSQIWVQPEQLGETLFKKIYIYVSPEMHIRENICWVAQGPEFNLQNAKINPSINQSESSSAHRWKPLLAETMSILQPVFCSSTAAHNVSVAIVLHLEMQFHFLWHKLDTMKARRNGSTLTHAV